MNDGKVDFYLLAFAPYCRLSAWEADNKMKFSVQDVYQGVGTLGREEEEVGLGPGRVEL